MHRAGRRARHGDAGEIALHVGDEDRDAGGGEALGQALQSHRLAGAGRAGDQAVTVGPVEDEPLRLAAAEADENRGAVIHRTPLSPALPLLPIPDEEGRGKRDIGCQREAVARVSSTPT